jgi:ribonuclease BN (tRNA processing enzyme)
MRIKVLGSSGSEGPGHNPPAFLVDDFLLMDAGTVSLSLDRDAQCKISHIFLTHAHLDHIKGIPFLVDNMAAVDEECSLTILSGKDVITDLKKNIFNNRIWPDFSMIPTPDRPVMRYKTLSTRTRMQVRGYGVYATRVNHSVPAYGFMIEAPSGSSMVYSGDTGPTDRIWQRMRGHKVKVLIIEVSFPDAMIDLALASGHMTPSLLKQEIEKMAHIPEKIYVTHMKPFYRTVIEDQLAKFNGLGLTVLEDDMVISI